VLESFADGVEVVRGRWAEGRRYLRTVGIPLSPWRRDNGALLIAANGEPAAVELDPGDAVMMRADVPH
jgi:hypothetical protein